MKQLLLALLLTSLTTLPTFAQKQQSDREAEGFKGKVKTVTIEISLIDKSTGKPESTRQRGRMETFDVDGNLTEHKTYDPWGDVLATLTYSFLDGERVVKREIQSKRMMVVTPVTPGKEPTRPSDPRYTARIKYKYDSQGIRTEMVWVNSDGSPGVTRVYRLTGNEKEESVYSEGGSLSEKYTYKFDDKGNEVERLGVLYDTPGGLMQSKTTYAYQKFDSQGNWIARRESSRDSSWIIYRTITYH